MPNLKEGPLFWIQSVDDPAVALVLTDPTQFFLDYRVRPRGRDRRTLGLEQDDECYALAVVTVHPDRSVTLNLAAPLLFASRYNRACQVILEHSGYSSRTPLPEIEQRETSGHAPGRKKEDCSKIPASASR